ncbi:pectinesterase inhibitor-like [Alnus glutinosa]|uniref:pectinesterase inhibitor-like n=1 Tax=Alnus glutinosa TaxID=3517 RepID=UPI002D767EE0|nr:pectinesterase inhibitor-like [Alnus glutinosa]
MGIKLLGVSIPLLVISIIAVTSTAADEKGKPLITKTCAGTEFPDVCTSTLESDPRSLSADLKGLSRIALELSATKGNDSAGLAYNLMQNASGYEPWSERSACFHGYNTSVYQIKDQGLQSFDEGKYDKAYEAVDLLNKEALRCNTFQIPELDESNTMLSEFTTVVKTILQLLF